MEGGESETACESWSESWMLVVLLECETLKYVIGCSVVWCCFVSMFLARNE